MKENIGIARGCTGCTCTPPPRVEKKIWGLNVQWTVVSAPSGKARVQILRRFLLGGGDLEGGSN